MAPPLGRQDCKIAYTSTVSKIEACPPPLYKLGMRFDHTKGMCCAFLPGFGRKIGLNFSEDLFFCSSPNFGPKIGLNLSGTISDSDLYFSQIFSNFCPPPPPLLKILRTLLHQRFKELNENMASFYCLTIIFYIDLNFFFFFRFCVLPSFSA